MDDSASRDGEREPNQLRGQSHTIDPSQFDGQQVFRFDTFGDERFWTDELRLNEAIQAALDPLHAERSATDHYRTTPLRGLLDHAPYFHDGSAATLEAVVEHYDGVLDLPLDPDESADLVQYLRSL